MESLLFQLLPDLLLGQVGTQIDQVSLLSVQHWVHQVWLTMNTLSGRGLLRNVGVFYRARAVQLDAGLLSVRVYL